MRCRCFSFSFFLCVCLFYVVVAMRLRRVSTGIALMHIQRRFLLWHAVGIANIPIAGDHAERVASGLQGRHQLVGCHA